uniref:FERM, ARH/RhoGEF and pleckstrin domain protein 2 n=1 Tax=Monodelphis domestica TaxID=13616 RepID=A0A5F8GGN0_MONDO
MGEIEGTYRVLETPGSRLGGPNHTGISTLEPGQSLSSAMVKTSAKLQEKDLPIKVRLLDNTTEILHVEPKCYGQILLTEVFKHLNLIESDYFGLEFQNVQSYWIWLEPTKPIIKQVQRPRSTLLRLAVKFFPPDPGQLQEEYTRYLFALQIKRDLVEERMPCSDSTAALLTSHLLQMLVGDYEEVTDREHLKTNKYVPHQDRIQERILENHQKHVGQTPAESDFQVLEIARKLEMYGIRFHLASDREGTKINLAVSHMGVLVFQGNTKINTFNWSKVRKLSFKRKRFLIKLHPEVHGPHQDTLEFLLGSRDECKNFWKICVEYHTFFRLLDQPKPKAKAVFFSRGSSFRYSGRTQRQLVDYVKDSGMKKTPYERRHSKARIASRPLSKDGPKQSISYTEGSRLPGSPCSSDASFHPGPAADLPPCMDSSRAFVASKAPLAERSSGPSAEEAEQKAGPPGGSPLLQSFQGVGSCHVARSYSSPRPGPPARDAFGLALERGRGLTRSSDNGERGAAPGAFTSTADGHCNRHGLRAAPVFPLTNSQLQVSEEFIDDDPAEISFFAGGSEAFSYAYGYVAVQEGLSASPSGARAGQASPDRYSTVDRQLEEEAFELAGESDFHGNARPSDTSELFEVKARASRMQSLLSPSETSSLLNHQSESSSLNMPLANQSEASSMVNFPAYSVRSEGSSAFQFSDILDQLEQLSCPPTTTEDSSTTETDSWDSDPEAPLDVNLFFSNPFAQADSERFMFDFQKNLKNLAQEEPAEQIPLSH